MKKILASLAVATLVVCSAQAQGTILFQNWSATGTPAVQRIYDVDGTTGLAGADYVAELWLVGGSAPLATKGFLGGGALASTSAVVIDSIGGGSDAEFTVRVWNNTTGASYDAATIRGESAPFTIRLADATSPNQPLLITPASGTAPNNVPFQSFNLQVVPEPSVIMLGLAGAGLLWFRRKK